MNDFSKLADLCERADAPSRSLDYSIFRATSPVAVECWLHWDDHQREMICPRYTASIDLAVSLVPKGFSWRCGYSYHVPHQAELVDYEGHSGRYDGSSDHSRALAICTAVLRALSSQVTSNQSNCK